MGEGSVREQKGRPPKWKLSPPHDTLTQGLVVSAFGHLPVGEALFLFFDWPTGGTAGAGSGGKGEWLRTLQRVAPITDSDRSDPRAAVIAFTWTGLERMGLSADALATFSTPFREGMTQEDRLRRLGDKVDGVWQGTVIKDGPVWSANVPDREREGATGDLTRGAGGEAPRKPDGVTPTTVHALVLLYAKTEIQVETWEKSLEDALASHHVGVVHRLRLDLRLDENDIGREHFGFADGISQPLPFGDGVILSGRPAERDGLHGVPLGEILIGHTNAHHENAPGPVLKADAAALSAELTTEGAPEGFCNFGLDGSYMVVRELQQNVAAFWKSIHEGAARIQAHDRSATHATPDWLAERIVGRNIDGHLLCPRGLLAADDYQQPQNVFRFMEHDPHGRGCPPGSHVRRTNPRDGLARDAASAQTHLDASNNHRILRRGRKYGTTSADPRVDDGQERGLLFICLNTDIARQFEFVQQTWVLNRNFATLFDETDPLVGPKGTFTIREEPLRRIVEVETFVRLTGGDYFFLPSIPALNYLATL